MIFLILFCKLKYHWISYCFILLCVCIAHYFWNLFYQKLSQNQIGQSIQEWTKSKFCGRQPFTYSTPQYFVSDDVLKIDLEDSDILKDFNAFVHNILKWPNIATLKIARFLKCVWPIYNIMHERVNHTFQLLDFLNRETRICVYCVGDTVALKAPSPHPTSSKMPEKHFKNLFLCSFIEFRTRLDLFQKHHFVMNI